MGEVDQARSKQPKSEKLMFLYNNIGGQSRKIWSELLQGVPKNKWEIIALTETHWRQGCKAASMPGYRVFKADRDVVEKKGGGIAICKERKAST